MTHTKDEALFLALEALERATRYGAGGFEDAKDSIKQALAEPVQSYHVFTITKTGGALAEWEPTRMAFVLPDGKYDLYTAPPAAQPAVQRGSCGHESCDCRSYCKKQQPAPVHHLVPDPAATLHPELYKAAWEAMHGAAPVQSLECAHCHVTIETLNDKAMYLIDENQRLRAELKFNTPPAQPAVPLTERDLASACLSYRHDFGLMDETNRGLLMFQAREWARAFGLILTTAAPEKGQS